MEEEKRKVIAITGANSFLGANLCQRLQIDSRYKVIAIDMKKPSFLLKDTLFYKVDLTEPTVDLTLSDIISTNRIDTVVHCAFFTNPTRKSAYAHELEVIGTMHLLHACAKVGIRKFILRSSTLVYGANPLNPNFITEDYPLAESSNYRYIRDKVEVEKMVEKFKRKNPNTIVTILRFGIILGPTVKNFFTEYLRRPFVITLLGYDPLFQFLHEEDAVDALKLAVEKDCDGVYNIVGDGVLPISTVIKLAGRINMPVFHPVAIPLVQFLFSTGVSPIGGKHLDFLRFVCIADGEKAKKEMGFIPKYSVKECIESFAGMQRLRELHLVE
jgi:UDP-glucose 4-epimerase